MAKMDKKHQAQTEKAAGFEPIDDGVYHVRLHQVITEGRVGPSGPYWTWEFDVVEPGDAQGRKLWNNTSLSEAAAFKMKETYDAFGADYDADTDDLCGEICKAVVSTRTIQSGSREGELGNQIDRLLPADEGFEAAEGVPAGQAADDLF